MGQETIGDRIKKQREKLNISLESLAAKLNIDEDVLRSYENNEKEIPASLLPSIAESLFMSYPELLGQEVKTEALVGPEKEGSSDSKLKFGMSLYNTSRFRKKSALTSGIVTLIMGIIILIVSFNAEIYADPSLIFSPRTILIVISLILIVLGLGITCFALYRKFKK